MNRHEFEKSQQNKKLEQFCPEGILVYMLRSNPAKDRREKLSQAAVGGYRVICFQSFMSALTGSSPYGDPSSITFSTAPPPVKK